MIYPSFIKGLAKLHKIAIAALLYGGICSCLGGASVVAKPDSTLRPSAKVGLALHKGQKQEPALLLEYSLEWQKYFVDDKRVQLSAGLSTWHGRGSFRTGGPNSGQAMENAFGWGKRGRNVSFTGELHASYTDSWGRVAFGFLEGPALSFALFAPRALRLYGVSGWKRDPSFFADIKTHIDATGLAAKIRYDIPANLWGGAIGSLQAGLAYTPKLRRFSSVQQKEAPYEDPDWHDVMEAGAYYQRRVGQSGVIAVSFGGLSMRNTSIYKGSFAKETIKESLYEGTFGLLYRYNSWTVGTMWKTSRHKLRGDRSHFSGLSQPKAYDAWEAAILRRTGPWEVSLNYGYRTVQTHVEAGKLPAEKHTQHALGAGLSYHLNTDMRIGIGLMHLRDTLHGKDYALSFEMQWSN